jgi:hypothetical protein
LNFNVRELPCKFEHFSPSGSSEDFNYYLSFEEEMAPHLPENRIE